MFNVDRAVWGILLLLGLVTVSWNDLREILIMFLGPVGLKEFSEAEGFVIHEKRIYFRESFPGHLIAEDDP